ncbi:MAG: hypothetical protein HZB34_12820 [Nitrospirae bacterium]|nr:hypothetical protein [Nitrospirota bacterium]
MQIVFLLLLSLLFSITPALADPGFGEKYERDYIIFNPINQYRPDNPLNPINAYDPKNPFNPVNQYDPGNPANPINQFNPNNPFNSINQFNPKNPLNPINQRIQPIYALPAAELLAASLALTDAGTSRG